MSRNTLRREEAMKGIVMMLKAFGIEITPEQADMITALIPQLPGKVNELIQVINMWDARLKNIEKQVEEINGRRSAGTSANVQ
jgi:hypothetical protein